MNCVYDRIHCSNCLNCLTSCCCPCTQCNAIYAATHFNHFIFFTFKCLTLDYVKNKQYTDDGIVSVCRLCTLYIRDINEYLSYPKSINLATNIIFQYKYLIGISFKRACTRKIVSIWTSY